MARRKSLAFLDVGQGDCFVADTKSGAIIFDGGSSSEDQVGRYRILPYMKYLLLARHRSCHDVIYGRRSLEDARPV